MNWTSSKLKLLCIKGHYQKVKREFHVQLLRTSHFQCREHGLIPGWGLRSHKLCRKVKKQKVIRQLGKWENYF